MKMKQNRRVTMTMLAVELFPIDVPVYYKNRVSKMFTDEQNFFHFCHLSLQSMECKHTNSPKTMDCILGQEGVCGRLS